MIEIEGLSDNKIQVELTDVNKDNIKIVKALNDRIFPVQYQPHFYKDIIHHGKKNFNKLVTFGGSPIGVVLCRLIPGYLINPDLKLPEGYGGITINYEQSPKKEKETEAVEEKSKENVSSPLKPSIDCMIYISAFGLIPMFRSQGIGKQMMAHVLKLVEDAPGVKYIGLHVQTSNTEAIKFYKKNSFTIARTLETYYPRLTVPSAHLLAYFPKTSPESQDKVSSAVI